MGVPVYPTSVKSFTTKQDGIDTVVASHVNSLQDEVVGVQNHVGIVSELPDLNLPSLSGTGATVAKRVGPQVNGLKQWADFLNTYKAPLASPTFTGTVTLPSATSIGTVTAAQIGTLAGITTTGGSTIQAQLNGKANLAGGTFTGNVNFDAGLWTQDINTRVLGNLNLNANGGVVVARNNGALTRVMCSAPISADDAVNKGTLDNYGVIYNQAFAKRPSGWAPTWGANEMAVTCGWANQHISLAAWGTGYPYLSFSVNGGTVGVNGGWIAVGAIPASSLTVKDDIRDLTEEEKSAFDMIEPQAFRYKDTGEFHFGFIAEEVEAAGVPIPMIPYGQPPTDPDEELTLLPGLYDRDLIAILWAQVKKQQRQIEVLTEQIQS